MTREVPQGAYCDHAAMRECCEGCNHYACPCEIYWDENAEGGSFDENLDKADA